MKKGLSDLNSIESLVVLNKDVEIVQPPWDQTRHTIGEGASNTGAGGQFNNSPLKIGTAIRYWNRRKENVPVERNPGEDNLPTVNRGPDPDLQRHLGG